MKFREITSLHSIYLTIAATMIAFSSSRLQASEVTATYRASHGPVDAKLELNEGLIGKLTIAYTGHLYSCSCSNYSCTGNPVDVVFVTNRGGPRNSETKQMVPLCRQPYHGSQGDQNAAVVTVGELWSTTAIWWDFLDIRIWRGIIGDLSRYYSSASMPEGLREIEVAFSSSGRWDSRNGENYRLNLVKVGDSQ